MTLARTNFRLAERIRESVRQMAREERGDMKKLQGSGGEWRLRVGDWRVIFEREGKQVRILNVTNRRDAYD